MLMIDKEYCMSSYLAFRFVVRDDMDFYSKIKHKKRDYTTSLTKKVVYNYRDIDDAINSMLSVVLHSCKKLGILLSGGMDSAILASYMNGCDAYTFRFNKGCLYQEELKRAELYANIYGLNLHYVDINWNDTVEMYLDALMKNKGCPVHSIEPEIMQAALQAKNDGVEVMIVGAASDDVFGGIDKLLSKDWKYEEFKKRYIFTNPYDVLNKPVDMDIVFSKWKKGKDDIDYMGFLDAVSTLETELSFQNAFDTAKLNYFDSYELLKMGEPLDFKKIRNGQSKYLIRELFAYKYPNVEIPEKLPLPRPVDLYFKEWKGPCRPEFKKGLDINKFTGNQKWQLYCLERFLNLYEQ